MVATLYQVRRAYNYANGPGFEEAGLLVVDDDTGVYTLQLAHFVGFRNPTCSVDFALQQLTREQAHAMVAKGERDHAENLRLYREHSYTDGTYPNEVVRLSHGINPFALPAWPEHAPAKAAETNAVAV